MEILRLIVTGAPGVGKSTFIRSISELEAANPKPTGMASPHKGPATPLDFGRLKFNPDIVMHLYGPPGQAGFDFMWNLLTYRAHACIMLLAAHQPKEFSFSRRLLSFMKQRVNVPVVVGLTHMDHPSAWSVENVALALGCTDNSRDVPIIAVNPMEKASVALVLMALVEHLRHIEHLPRTQAPPDPYWRTQHGAIAPNSLSKATTLPNPTQGAIANLQGLPPCSNILQLAGTGG